MNSNHFDYIHMVLQSYGQDLPYVEDSALSKNDKTLTKKELTLIFQTIDEVANQQPSHLGTISSTEIDKRIRLIETIKHDIDSLYNQYIHRIPPKNPSGFLQTARKMWKAFSKLLTTPFQKNVPSIDKTYKQLKQDLDKARAQLVHSQYENLADLRERFSSLASKWQEFVSHPNNVPLIEAQETLEQLLLQIDGLIAKSSSLETMLLLKETPELFTLFSTQSLSNADDFQKRFGTIFEAWKEGKLISSFASDPIPGKQIASLLGEEEGDYKDIPIRTGIIAERGFQHPERHQGFWRLKTSAQNFLSLHPEIEKAFSVSRETMQCRGLYLEFTQQEEQEQAFKKVLDLVKISPLPFVSLAFSHPLILDVPPTGLKGYQRREFFRLLSKLEIKTPVVLRLNDALSHEETQCLLKALPHVSELDLARQPIDWIRATLLFFQGLKKLSLAGTKVNDLDLARWQYEGIFDQIEELDLRECSQLTSKCYFPLPILMRETPQLRVHFPTSLPKAECPFPRGEDALRLQALLTRDNKDDIVHSPEENHLSPSNLALWLELDRQFSLPSNPYVVSINAQNVSELTNADLSRLIKKFPNVQEIDLKGCTQLTEEAFLDSAVQGFLNTPSWINLQSTGVSLDVRAQLQERFPALALADFTMIVGSKEFDFSRQQLMPLSSYWKNQFSKEGALHQKDRISLEDTADRSFNPEVFAYVHEYVKTGNFTKTTFTEEEAEQFFVLSQFFGRELYQKCVDVLTAQIDLPTISSLDLDWIRDLAERYTENELLVKCKRQIPKKGVPVEPFISPSGTLNLIVSDSSRAEPLSLFIHPEILAKHSPFFEAMFRWEKGQKNRNQLFLEEDPKAFLELCRWMDPQYEASSDHLHEVLSLADKYLISSELLFEKIEPLFDTTKVLSVDLLKFLSRDKIGKIAHSEKLKNDLFWLIINFIKKEVPHFENAPLILRILNLYDFTDFKFNEFAYIDFKFWHLVDYFFQNLADQGNAIAQTYLGCRCRDNIRERNVSKEVRKLYKQAADQGYAPAQYQLGLYCDKEQDFVKAKELYRQAADQGYAKAQYLLAICYEKGYVVEKDLKKARKLYQQAADQGHAQAQIMLGNYYEKGYGGEQDLNKARKLYLLSADQGNFQAKANLNRLDFEKKIVSITYDRKGNKEIIIREGNKEITIVEGSEGWWKSMRVRE